MVQAVAAWAPIDVLVNCAGVQHTAPVDEMPASRWDAILAINLSAAFHCMRLALPAMRERGYGRVVNIASVHGLVASVNKAPYVASKFGLVGLSKVAALECASAGSRGSGGITVNCICPGWVETDLIEPQVAARVPRRRHRDDGVRALAGGEAAEPAHVAAGRDRCAGAVAVPPGGAQPDRRRHSRSTAAGPRNDRDRQSGRMTRLLIADDHPLYRQALAQAVRGLIPEAHIIEAADLPEALGRAHGASGHRPGAARPAHAGQPRPDGPGFAARRASGRRRGDDLRARRSGDDPPRARLRRRSAT
jgi:NAD(P)-dependent dehydrogenase (short-subunit alcohol dehydrogenase family)